MRYRQVRCRPAKGVSTFFQNRCAFSVLELLISIGILGLLLAILLPAVQNSREAARKIQCLSNLKQLGIATQNFIDTHGRLPTGESALTQLLPFVEGPTPEAAQRGVNLPLYVCPSDETTPENLSVANYRMNDGSQLALDGKFVQTFRNGVYTYIGRVKEDEGHRPADFTDGLSTTALFSERRYGPGIEKSGDACQKNPIYCIWYIRQEFLHGQEEAFIDYCRDPSHRMQTSPQRWGEPYSIFAWQEPYHHILPPNAIACYSRPAGNEFEAIDGAITPTSRHRGGVNIAFCDGSARLIADGIAISVWRALGSRNGNEVIGEF